MRGLTDQVADALDRRLAPESPGPIAVALSGGGDSVALTLMAADWARRHGRPLVVLTVDHQLNPASAGWTQACASLAARLGCDFRALAWTGDKPATGLPAAARAVRHRLLACAARAAGARVILMGHTADDRAEAAEMRSRGSTTPDPREWAASPVWPEGCGVFVLRPMLQVARAELRDWLAARGEAWIDDPANDNPRFARARARAALDGAAPAEVLETAPPGLADLARQVRGDHGLSLARQTLREAGFEAARVLVGTACLCAAGTSRPPRRERLHRLAEALRGGADLVATLAGARVEADAGEVRWLREAGEIARLGLRELSLDAGQTGVWDGRFEIVADHAVTLSPLAGHAARLPPEARARLALWPAAARGGLPALTAPAVASPLLQDIPGLSIRPLDLDRLYAACGLVEREPG